MPLPKDNDILLELHKTVSLRGIAEMYDVSHQGVSNRLSKLLDENITKTRLRLSECAREQYRAGAKVEDLAKKFNKSESTIYRWCDGIKRPNPALKDVGCDDCESKPYAKGLCKNCYNRKWRQENLR